MSTHLTPQAAQELKLKGATEETDVEFARLMSLLRYYQQNSLVQQQPPPGPTTGDALFSPAQLSTLRHQIMAFKELSCNKPLSQNLKEAVLSPLAQDSKESNGTVLADPIPLKIVDVTFAHEKQKTAQLSLGPNSDPYSFVSKARPGTLDVKQRLIIPSILPAAPEPLVLRKERERFLAARVSHRIKELESLPGNLNNDGSLKLKALIELKALRLLERQKKLRSDLVQSISKSTTLATAVDRAAFRRMKRQSLREARQTEKQERSNRAERDKKERQKHLDYLSSILTHGRDMVSFHRNQASKAARLGAAVLRFHGNAAKEEERRVQRNAEERLKALKENDEEAYLKLIDKTKDKRITHLLAQTTSFLQTLTNAISVQKVHSFFSKTHNGSALRVKKSRMFQTLVNPRMRKPKTWTTTTLRIESRNK